MPSTRVVFPPDGVPTKVHSHKAREPKTAVRLSVHAASGKSLKMVPKA